MFPMGSIVWTENSCHSHFSSSLPKLACSFRVSWPQEVTKAVVQKCDKSSSRALSSRLNTLPGHDTDPV